MGTLSTKSGPSGPTSVLFPIDAGNIAHGAVLKTHILGDEWTVVIRSPQDDVQAPTTAIATYDREKLQIIIAPDADFDHYFIHEVFEYLLNELWLMFTNHDHTMIFQFGHEELDTISKCLAGAIKSLRVAEGNDATHM